MWIKGNSPEKGRDWLMRVLTCDYQCDMICEEN